MSFIEIDESSREILNLALGFLESQEMKDYLKNYDFSKSLARTIVAQQSWSVIGASDFEKS